MANMRATVPCRWCNAPTEMLGTRECDPCHELSRRIQRASPDLFVKMLAVAGRLDEVEKKIAELKAGA